MSVRYRKATSRYRRLKTRAAAKPIASAPIIKLHEANACSASSICPRLKSTIVSNANIPGIMITIGATVTATGGTLKRCSTTKATRPIDKAAKNAAGAGIMPRSIRISRKPLAPKATRPVASATRGELLKIIAKADPETKLATPRNRSVSG